MKRSTAGAALVLALATASQAPAITPPDQVEFNYPAPPREGKPDFFTIAENGQARCVIVRPRRLNNEEQRAAGMLKTYVQLSSGAEIPVLTEGQPVPPGSGVIHIGDTAVARGLNVKLPDVRYGKLVLPNINGYFVATPDEKTLVICGAQPAGTQLGVVGFLRRYMGIRRYWPGNPGGLGDVVPKIPALRVPEIEWRDWPYFISRVMSGLDAMSPEIDKEYAPVFKNGLGVWLRMNYTIPSNENYYRLLPIKDYGHIHPEYFPLINGKRFVPPPDNKGAGWQPCVSNPAVAEIMAKAIIDHFKKNPDAIAMNLAVNDGAGDCHCDACRAMDPPGADVLMRRGLSDRYIKFNNKVCEIVAREYPNKIISFLSYGSISQPPTTVQLHPMLMPSITCGGDAFEKWDNWAATGAAHMGMYLYHDDYWFLLPKLDVHQSAKRIRYMVASNRGRGFYQEFYGLWPLDGMVGHIQAELTWDPRRNPDDLLGEYYATFYGPASAPMRRFYEVLEAGYERYLEAEGSPHPFGKDVGSMSNRQSFAQFKVLRPEESDKALAALSQALAANGDELVSQRVDMVVKVFGFADLGLRQYWLAEDMQKRTVGKVEDAQRLVGDARRLVKLGADFGAYKRDVMEKPPITDYAKHVRDDFYAAIHPDGIPADDWGVMAAKFREVSLFLKKEQGPDRAGEWWAGQVRAEQDKWLRGAMKNAETVARGVELANLVKDPGFETRGAQMKPADAAGPVEGHSAPHGVNIYISSGTPSHVELTKSEAHSGQWSVLLSECQSTVVSEGLSAKPGERYRLSVWVRHNDVKGNAPYRAFFMPRSKEGIITRTYADIPWNPGVWQEVSMDVIVPETAVNFAYYVSGHFQPSGAKLWVDDFFIGKYPD